MSFISLSVGTLHKKREKKRFKNFAAGYVGKLYRNLADGVDHDFVGSDFYGRIESDAGIPSADIQEYILVTSDFAKGIQTDINHYVTKDRINNVSFRQKLDPISKNIIRRQNPLELVFEDISTFDAENPIVGSLLKELDVGKKDIASEVIKKASRPPGVNFAVRKRFKKLKNRPEPKDGDDNFNLLSPASPPRPATFGTQYPPPPLGPPPAPPFFPPPSARFLEPSQ